MALFSSLNYSRTCAIEQIFADHGALDPRPMDTHDPALVIASFGRSHDPKTAHAI
jgi:hypothetical protein